VRRCQPRHVTTLSGTDSQDPVYLVERYLAAPDAADLTAAVTRLTRACHATAGSAAPVRYLHSTFVPADDTCFCLFQAASSEAVRAVNAAALFGFDRISDARVIRSFDQ
jgi:hypothetical protein